MFLGEFLVSGASWVSQIIWQTCNSAVARNIHSPTAALSYSQAALATGMVLLQEPALLSCPRPGPAAAKPSMLSPRLQLAAVAFILNLLTAWCHLATSHSMSIGPRLSPPHRKLKVDFPQFIHNHDATTVRCFLVELKEHYNKPLRAQMEQLSFKHLQKVERLVLQLIRRESKGSYMHPTDNRAMGLHSWQKCDNFIILQYNPGYQKLYLLLGNNTERDLQKKVWSGRRLTEIHLCCMKGSPGTAQTKELPGTEMQIMFPISYYFKWSNIFQHYHFIKSKL